jgi:putative RNA 2'-phosphotransferase
MNEGGMEERRTVKVSKYLSKHLRHQPVGAPPMPLRLWGRIGLVLGEGGWVEVEVLMAAAAHGFRFTRDELDHVVAHNDKRRFAIEGTRIRASQGHSIEVDLGLPPATPPAYLYHGTVARGLDAIRAEGLRPMSLHDVHLSSDRETARPRDRDPRRRPPRPSRRALRGRRRHAPRRPRLPRQRQRGLAHSRRTRALPAVSRPALTSRPPPGRTARQGPARSARPSLTGRAGLPGLHLGSEA